MSRVPAEAGMWGSVPDSLSEVFGEIYRRGISHRRPSPTHFANAEFYDGDATRSPRRAITVTYGRRRRYRPDTHETGNRSTARRGPDEGRSPNTYDEMAAPRPNGSRFRNVRFVERRRPESTDAAAYSPYISLVRISMLVHISGCAAGFISAFSPPFGALVA